MGGAAARPAGFVGTVAVMRLLIDFAMGFYAPQGVHQTGSTPDRALTSLAPEIASGHLQVRFPRRLAGTSDLTDAVQVSPDLRDWSSLTASEVGVEPGDLPGFDEAIFQAAPEASAQSPLYLRLMVSLP